MSEKSILKEILEHVSRKPGFRKSGNSTLTHINVNDLIERKKFCEEIAEILSVQNNDYDYIKNNIAYNIREYRKFNGFTQKEMAETIGVERQYIGMLESGSKMPSLDIICKLANQMNVSIAFFTATRYPFDTPIIAKYIIQEERKKTE